MTSFHGYFINVDGMVQRRTHMQDQLKSMGLHEIIDRWPAVDAGELQDITSTPYSPGHWRSEKWELTRFEVAVFESHRRIWRRIAEAPGELVVVLEDDVVLSNRFSEIMGHLAAIDDCFDVVKLDGVDKIRRFGAPLDLSIDSIPNLEIRPICQTIWSAAGYVVSKTGADRLLKWSNEYSVGVDDFLFQPRLGYRLYQLFPAVCAQGMTLLPRQELMDEQSYLVRGENSPKYVTPRRNRGPLVFRVAREIKRGMGKLRCILYDDKRLISENGFVGVVPLAYDLDRRN